MPYAEIGGNTVVAPAGFMLVVVGEEKPGGALPEPPVPPYCWIVVMGVAGGRIMAA